MIVDSSALVAIALDEPGADALIEVLAEALGGRISAANLLETWMVVDGRRRPEATQILEALLGKTGLTVESVTLAQVELARIAFAQFGRGSGHSARLNFGDCFAYALAKERNEPLLFVGNDFSRTDIVSATDKRE